MGSKRKPAHNRRPAPVMCTFYVFCISQRDKRKNDKGAGREGKAWKARVIRTTDSTHRQIPDAQPHLGVLLHEHSPEHVGHGDDDEDRRRGLGISRRLRGAILPASAKPTSETTRAGRSSSVESPRRRGRHPRHDLRATGTAAKDANHRANFTSYDCPFNAPSTYNRVRLSRHTSLPLITQRSLQPTVSMSFKNLRAAFDGFPQVAFLSILQSNRCGIQLGPPRSSYRGYVTIYRRRRERNADREKRTVSSTANFVRRRHVCRRRLVPPRVRADRNARAVANRELCATTTSVRVTRRRTAVFQIPRHRRQTSHGRQRIRSARVNLHRAAARGQLRGSPASRDTRTSKMTHETVTSEIARRSGAVPG